MDMADALLRSFTLVSVDKCDTVLQHPRFAEYKNRPFKQADQDNRRKEVLDRQKKKRFDAVNYARKLADGDLNEDDYEDACMEIEDEEKQGKKFNPYCNQLMLSEWLVDVPPDLISNWVMVVCPVGKRCLVVAHRGHTTAFTKSGYCVKKFPSLLPGGSYKSCKGSASSGYTILDCVYDEMNQTFWMLDLMCMNGHPVYDSEADFRFFWLNSKLHQDQPQLREKSKVNPFKFIPCMSSNCSPQEVVHAVTSEYSFQLDGLLFYHRQGHYRPGRTPLVGWLKPYMIPDMLGIPLPQTVMENSPAFNKQLLVSANKELQLTVSDKSFGSDNNARRSQSQAMDVQHGDSSAVERMDLQGETQRERQDHPSYNSSASEQPVTRSSKMKILKSVSVSMEAN